MFFALFFLVFMAGVLFGYVSTRNTQKYITKLPNRSMFFESLLGKEYTLQNYRSNNKQELKEIKNWIRENYPSLTLSAK